MQGQAVDTPTNGTQQSTDPQANYPIIDLEFTARGVLLKKTYSEEEMSVQFVRIAAITFPKKLELYSEKQLPKHTSKTIKNLRYNKSKLIDEEATYSKLRNAYLLYNQTTVDLKATRERLVSSYLSQLIKNNVHIHIINSPIENTFLIIGVEYSSKLLIHPQSEVKSEIILSLVNQHYLLDQYPNLKGMSSLVKIDRDFKVSFFRSTKAHSQMQIIDRTIFYKLIERISQLSKLDGKHQYDYNIDGFESNDQEIAAFCFSIYLEDGGSISYSQKVGSSLIVLANPHTFQSWLTNYSFQQPYLKSPQIEKLDTTIIVVGGPKPIGYQELDPKGLRLDLLDLIRENPYYVWIPVFRLMHALYAYSVKQNIAADFNQYWSDLNEALGDLMTQIDSFDMLVEKLEDSFENEINITIPTVERSLLSAFRQIKLLNAFSKKTDPSMDQFIIPRRLYLSTDNYSPKDILLFIYIFALRADIEGDPLQTIVSNDYDLSGLMVSTRIQAILDDKNTGFDDVSKVHRATRMNQTRFNHLPRIILSYNKEVRTLLTKNRFVKYEEGQIRIPMFEKSCLLLPDQPLRRIFCDNPSEDFISAILKYQMRSTETVQVVQTIDSIDEQSEIQPDDVEEEQFTTEQQESESNQSTDTYEETAEDTEDETEPPHNPEDIPIEQPIHEQYENNENTEEEVEVELQTKSPVDEPEELPERPQQSKNEKEIDQSIEEKEGVLTKIDEAMTQYSEIFNSQQIYDRLLKNKPGLSTDEIFTQIDILTTNLQNLYECYITTDFSLSAEEITSKGMKKLQENELIILHPVDDTFMIRMTEKGNSTINQTLKSLNLRVGNLKDKNIDIQNIIINSSSIMEKYRQQGNIRYEVALINWPELLSLAYYDKFSKLAPIAHGITAKLSKIIDDGAWITDHDEFIKSFVKKYQTNLYEIEQEILSHKDTVLQKAELKTLPKINIIKPATSSNIPRPLDSKDEESHLESGQQVVTNLVEYDHFEEDKKQSVNTTDREIIDIITFEKEAEKKPVVKPKKTKAAKERAARNLLKNQKEVFADLVNATDYEDEFSQLEEIERKQKIDYRINTRLATIIDEAAKKLYFFQPSWDMNIDEGKQKFDLEELPLSLFNFKPKTKRMLSGVLDNPTIGELLKVNIDWTKLPSIGKKGREEIVDYQLLFRNWNVLEGSKIFTLMSHSGLEHLFEQKIYFEPQTLPENILLPLHQDLRQKYLVAVDDIIKQSTTSVDGIDISRKIVNSIYNELCKVLEIEVEKDQTEVLLHKINQYQFSNHMMSKAEDAPRFDLSWILKFDNYHNTTDEDRTNESMSLQELREKYIQELDDLILPYQVQKQMLELDKGNQSKNTEQSNDGSIKKNTKSGRQLA